ACARICDAAAPPLEQVAKRAQPTLRANVLAPAPLGFGEVTPPEPGVSGTSYDPRRCGDEQVRPEAYERSVMEDRRADGQAIFGRYDVRTGLGAVDCEPEHEVAGRGGSRKPLIRVKERPGFGLESPRRR